MPVLIEDAVVTTEESRLYFSVTDTVTITPEATTVPTGWVELDENSKFDVDGKITTDDGQTRATRGHERPIRKNRSGAITFEIKPKPGTDPQLDHGLEEGVIARFLFVNGDGVFSMHECLVTGVREGADVAGLQTWTGTAARRLNPVRGRITVWPPVVGP